MKAEHAQRVYFEQLKRTVPIGAVLARYGIELKRGKSCCPIHSGSNPTQFSVDENKNLWRCFSPSCDRGGDVLALVAELEKIEIRDAALLIADWFAIKPSSDVQHRKQQQRSRTMSEGSKPTHKVYSAQKREGQKDWLTRIGSAWPFETKDKRTGLNIQLTAMPLGDRMVIFENDLEEEDNKKDAGSGSKFKKK